MHKKIIALLLILVLILPPTSYSQDSDVNTMVVQGWDAMSQEDLQGALLKFEKALAIEPDHTLALLGKGRSLLYLNRLKEAQDVYLTVLEKDPENKSALLGLARAYQWEGEYSLAEETYQELLRISPDDLEAQEELSKVSQWQGELQNARILVDPRDKTSFGKIKEIKGNLKPTPKLFFNYLAERDANDFKSQTMTYGYQHRKPLASGNEIYAEYRREDYRETGKKHTSGNVLSLGGLLKAYDDHLNFNGRVDLKDFNQNVDFFAGGMVNTVWKYYENNSLTLQYNHELFDVIDDVKADRCSAELNNYLVENLLMTNYFEFADLSDDNDSQQWANSLTYFITKKNPDLSVSAGYRHRDYKHTSPNYYSPQDLGSIFYSLYIGKAWRKSYSYAMFKYYDNSDQIDDYSYLLGTEYNVKENISLSFEVSYFDTTDKYHALGASAALNWKF